MFVKVIVFHKTQTRELLLVFECVPTFNLINPNFLKNEEFQNEEDFISTLTAIWTMAARKSSNIQQDWTAAVERIFKINKIDCNFGFCKSGYW